MGQARIGKVTLRGGAQLHRIGGLPQTLHDRRRGHFLNHCAATYDAYLKDYEEVPDAMFIVLGGVKQTARSGWSIQGDSKGATSSMLALAVATLTREIVA